MNGEHVMKLEMQWNFLNRKNLPLCLLILSPAGTICICEGALALGAVGAGVSKQLNFASIDEES